MNYVPLVEETRAGLVENVHFGMICGVNDQLQTVCHAGNQDHYTFYRSASKPIQAIPVFLSTIISKYGLTRQEATLFTASHRGEKYHIDALESMLSKLPVEEEELFCPPSYPLNVTPREEMLRKNKEKRRLYHNCSAKHMGFVSVCRELGYPVEGYWEVNHPLQQQILMILSELSEVHVSDITIGKDGCGVPVFAIPLKNMAITYLKLACPHLIQDPLLQKAVKDMTSVMNEYPLMVASEQFICSILLQDSNIIAKGGAQGVYCFGLKNEKLGFALKVLNGSEDVWPSIVASILEQINYHNKETITRLRELKPSIIKNDAGNQVGAIKETFLLIQE
ncbi:asparaginase [Neobacillus sp. MM2021_6]|uniref:asparaginase n=1 Tax=Bacillaceae TaxID=186817 RepID=UPI00140D2A34|nr:MULTISPECIES: asparaginase [Bacillaceae]MBO0958828.1 asparaginase [Neobacillus sp. MM2021_6]NHC21385.1 asparaginase [Bacillus sp. MM2020_4]